MVLELLENRQMKRWQNYREYLLEGDWQVHSVWSDGSDSVFQYCERAKQLGHIGVCFFEAIGTRLEKRVKTGFFGLDSEHHRQSRP